VIPDVELGHVYKWPILTGIDVDKDFYETHFNIKLFNSFFYIHFKENGINYYHKFSYLNEVKNYVTIKWAVLKNDLTKIKQNCFEIPLHIDDHWALITASKLGYAELTQYLKQSIRIDKKNITPLVEYIINDGRNN
jgi:Ulp1 family protease